MASTARGPGKASLGLSAGDWVVVRSKQEILATLDANGRLENLPFQPEMFAYCGRRMRVAKTAHKTCDAIHKTGGRRMERAVHLEGARCDGSFHGGCQADCVFFWKEDWIRRDSSAPELPAAASGPCTEDNVYARARAPGEETSSDPTWVCQTTALYEATSPLKAWDIRQYVRDVTGGNHSAGKMFKLLVGSWFRYLLGLGIGYRFLVAGYDVFQKLIGGKPFLLFEGKIPEGKRTPAEDLGLKPGDWVEVKSPHEIMTTITPRGFNRGMRFDVEMMKYCGGRYRVQMIVEKIVNEVTGKMLYMKSPCLQLEDVYCRAECTPMRLGCPRASNTYWREIWLRRVDGPKPADSAPQK
jgi:hypothetical protein